MLLRHADHFHPAATGSCSLISAGGRVGSIRLTRSHSNHMLESLEIFEYTIEHHCDVLISSAPWGSAHHWLRQWVSIATAPWTSASSSVRESFTPTHTQISGQTHSQRSVSNLHPSMSVYWELQFKWTQLIFLFRPEHTSEMSITSNRKDMCNKSVSAFYFAYSKQVELKLKGWFFFVKIVWKQTCSAVF